MISLPARLSLAGSTTKVIKVPVARSCVVFETHSLSLRFSKKSASPLSSRPIMPARPLKPREIPTE